MEDLLGSAHTTHTAPAVCLLIDTWHDPGVLPPAGHIHFPVGHSEGQAIACPHGSQSLGGVSSAHWAAGMEEGSMG